MNYDQYQHLIVMAAGVSAAGNHMDASASVITGSVSASTHLFSETSLIV